MAANSIIRLTTAAAILIALWMAAPESVLAHHSYSVYDRSKQTTLSGTIVEVSYANPHVNVRIDTGERVWRLDMPGPRRLRTRGLTTEVLQVGRTLEVLGWPHRNGSADFAPVRIVIDGRAFEIRQDGGR